jgi:hypothetical protein
MNNTSPRKIVISDEKITKKQIDQTIAAGKTFAKFTNKGVQKRLLKQQEKIARQQELRENKVKLYTKKIAEATKQRAAAAAVKAGAHFITKDGALVSVSSEVAAEVVKGFEAAEEAEVVDSCAAGPEYQYQQQGEEVTGVCGMGAIAGDLEGKGVICTIDHEKSKPSIAAEHVQPGHAQASLVDTWAGTTTSSEFGWSDYIRAPDFVTAGEQAVNAPLRDDDISMRYLNQRHTTELGRMFPPAVIAASGVSNVYDTNIDVPQIGDYVHATDISTAVTDKPNADEDGICLSPGTGFKLTGNERPATAEEFREESLSAMRALDPGHEALSSARAAMYNPDSAAKDIDSLPINTLFVPHLECSIPLNPSELSPSGTATHMFNVGLTDRITAEGKANAAAMRKGLEDWRKLGGAQEKLEDRCTLSGPTKHFGVLDALPGASKDPSQRVMPDRSMGEISPWIDYHPAAVTKTLLDMPTPTEVLAKPEEKPTE